MLPNALSGLQIREYLSEVCHPSCDWQLKSWVYCIVLEVVANIGQKIITVSSLLSSKARAPMVTVTHRIMSVPSLIQLTGPSERLLDWIVVVTVFCENFGQLVVSIAA